VTTRTYSAGAATTTKKTNDADETTRMPCAGAATMRKTDDAGAAKKIAPDGGKSGTFPSMRGAPNEREGMFTGAAPISVSGGRRSRHRRHTAVGLHQRPLEPGCSG
jgi:hypothetical protein